MAEQVGASAVLGTRPVVFQTPPTELVIEV
jgi:hypothetical protein